MNKREFVTGAVGAVGAAAIAPALAAGASSPGPAQAAGQDAAPPHRPARQRRLPDLLDRAGADTFEAYVGERFTVVDGESRGAAVVLRAVDRVARCASTEQFDLAFVDASDAVALRPGLHLLEHVTGQRLALRLDESPAGYAAHFNLLA